MACLFLHQWDGCKCKKCGKTRNEAHDWDLCHGRCKRCGTGHETQHDWNGCICTRCGKKRDEQHDWNGCKCNRCGKKRDEQHDWNGCICNRCGEKRDEQHDWDSCYGKCKICGKTRPKDGHKFIKESNSSSPCWMICSICGWEGYVHKWEPLNESKCEYHCSVCGQKAFIHKGFKELCPICGDKITVRDGAIDYKVEYDTSINYIHAEVLYEFYTNSGGRSSAGRMNPGTFLRKTNSFDEYAKDNYALEYLFGIHKGWLVMIMPKPQRL